MSPEDAAARGIEEGVAVRVFNDRGVLRVRRAGVDDARPGVLVAPMGWWNGDYPGGRSGQATTSQVLTREGNAPTFNDNRVELSADQPVVLLRHRMRPTASSRRRRGMRPRWTGAQHRHVGGLLVADGAGDVEHVRAGADRLHGSVGDRVERGDPRVGEVVASSRRP